MVGIREKQYQERNSLAEAFIAGSRMFFETYPQIEHSWGVIEGVESDVLEIPAATEDGFEINCVLEGTQIIFSTGGHHDHYELEGDTEEFVNHLLGILYDLLSSVMRIKEYRAGQSGYKWNLQMLEEKKWETESTSALMFYNFFARKSVKIFQNNQLPIR